ncbi:twin-arginine translocation signal domain-containing protein [Shewanella carassii]|uniref:Fnr-inducible formate dehydrogenase accessory protein FdhX n=1 Tax=Shewanella carassii TaxID=1987584 RepID=A0ABQ1T5F4_9GAMM|nr:twin-arginine translocation signal domain-containing protein [Shewanella carassii]BCV68418.1 Fnr-inducible formate dehydrogenase accessory protein FdhX [Shewanella carassii]GGE82376.1 Fnr-inducible formate dehydrogenase accessory protein FdhX [Shewanella carassii]
MKDQKPDLNRRSLLKAITIGSAAGAAIAATGVSAAQASETVEAKSENTGYHETAHIRSYYNSLRS